MLKWLGTVAVVLGFMVSTLLIWLGLTHAGALFLIAGLLFLVVNGIGAAALRKRSHIYLVVLGGVTMTLGFITIASMGVLLFPPGVLLLTAGLLNA